MNADDRAGFLKGLCHVAAIFDTEMPEARIEGYFAALKDLPLWLVEDAFDRAVQNCRFFPRPAELRAMVTEKPDAGALIASLQLAMRKYGTTPGFNPAPHLPPLLNMLIERLGGWYTVMGMPFESLMRHVEKLAPPLVEAASARGMSLQLLDAPPAQPPRMLEQAVESDPTPEGRALLKRLFPEKS